MSYHKEKARQQMLEEIAASRWTTMLNKQLEIQFFWTLTEQIPLDLEYTECAKPKISTKDVWTFSDSAYGIFQIGNGGSGGTTVATTGPGTMVLHAQNLVWKTNKKIPWWRKTIYKIMDIRLERE